MKVAIIGNGVAGMTVANTLRKKDADVEIEIYTDEPYGYYSRIWLPEIISEEKSLDEIITHDEEWYDKRNITLYMNTKVSRLDPENKKINLDHSSCNRCDKCFDVCTPHALEPVGSWWTVNELIEKILIDKSYFDSTGGGVTASGGEPTMQMAFLHHFLKALKQVNMDAGLETSGMFPLNPFKRLILPYLDFIYFDLKLIDPEDSRQYTGASNDLIIDNFLFLYNETTVPIIPRVPLIPGITATEENLSRISLFLKAHGITACALIPYNPFWHDKAIKTGIPINYSRSELMSQREEEDCIHYFSV